MNDRHPLLDAVAPLLDAIGATAVEVDEATGSDVVLSWEGSPVGAIRLPDLHGALDRLVRDVELVLGSSLSELDRETRLEAVRLLDDRGAFTLRRAVERIADLLGVSRFTVYNYLNADRAGEVR